MNIAWSGATLWVHFNQVYCRDCKQLHLTNELLEVDMHLHLEYLADAFFKVNSKKYICQKKEKQQYISL